MSGAEIFWDFFLHHKTKKWPKSGLFDTPRGVSERLAKKKVDVDPPEGLNKRYGCKRGTDVDGLIVEVKVRTFQQTTVAVDMCV